VPSDAADRNAGNAFRGALGHALDELGLPTGADRLAALAGHFDLMLRANTRFNLTRITDPATAAVQLYADSAAAIAWATRENVPIERVLDIGTGAGFPAVPLAVLRPGWQVTALEATGKKAAFVEQAARSLGLGNLQVVHAHSDHWRSEARFDLVTFKAIGRIEACLKTARRFVGPGGHVAVYKTAAVAPNEVSAARRAATTLGFTESRPLDYELPAPDGPARFTLYAYGLSEPTADR
jgi:16S rRNA (guanine527-N7)-methyltransferase